MRISNRPIRVALAAFIAAACAVAIGAPGCGSSARCVDAFTLDGCGVLCDALGDCEEACGEIDCRTSGSVCAEANGFAECVLPARESCSPEDDGSFRCSASSNGVEYCGGTGFWKLAEACGDPDTSGCFVAQDGKSGVCALRPVTDCASDPKHSECRGDVYVTCSYTAHVLVGELCPLECVAATDDAPVECW